jgi:hypothetical protein
MMSFVVVRGLCISFSSDRLEEERKRKIEVLSLSLAFHPSSGHAITNISSLTLPPFAYKYSASKREKKSEYGRITMMNDKTSEKENR